MKHEIDLPDLPDGFEYTGEYREAESGDNYRTWHGSVGTWSVEAVKSTSKYLILRKTAPASQLDRIKAEYAEYDVRALKWEEKASTEWLVMSDKLLHTVAQSMKGFGWYVYDDDDGLFLRLEAVIDNHDEALHPCAVLFTK